MAFHTPFIFFGSISNTKSKRSAHVSLGERSGWREGMTFCEGEQGARDTLRPGNQKVKKTVHFHKLPSQTILNL